MQVLLNGKVIPHRPFTEAELEPLRRQKKTAQEVYERRLMEKDPDPGRWLNLRKQMFLYLLAEPVGGDDITFRGDVPEDIEEVWIRWDLPEGSPMPGKGTYNMKIWSREP